ncbi:MAG: hypothetical protein H6832_08710 [Planctomycetes bacterium]|nr:hypothetical protein [Planctomycetota bacterium]MCB9918470.1 hypothetical protein [Planctomycetota bacterium]
MVVTRDGRCLGAGSCVSRFFTLPGALRTLALVSCLFVPRRVAAVPVGVPVVACIPAAQTSTSTEERRDLPKDEFARERKVLLGGGPSSDSEVSVIVAKLVRSDEAKAHELLSATLDAVPARASLSIGVEVLRALVREIGIDADAALRDEERARIERRFEYYESYVGRIVALCARQPGILTSGTNPRGDTTGHDPAAYRNLIRAFLMRLPDDVRRKALARTWQRADDPSARIGIRLAGICDDPRLAPDLARLLAEPSSREAARLALADLTWRAKPFEDLADFESWWADHKDASSAELAVIAARAARELGKEHRAELRAERERLQAKLLERSRELVGQLLGAPLPPWKRIGVVLDDPDLTELRASLLDDFADGLIRRGAPTDAIRPTLGELGVLRDHLAEQFGQANDDERGALLAAWTMSSKWSGGTAAKEIVDRLLGFLAARGGPVSLERLFTLLEEFPEDRVREQVFAALSRPENTSALASGIQCLRKLGLSERSSLVERSLDFFDAVVRDPQQTAKVRESALEALGEIASSQLAALQRLEGLVAPPDEAEAAPLADNLRLTALQWAVLQGRVWLQRMGNDELKARASADLKFLFACLSDASSRLRQESAKALSSYPGDVSRFTKEHVQEIGRNIVGRLGRALANESQLACARQELESLVRQAERAALEDVALAQLVSSLTKWSRDETQRRELLVPLRPVYRQDLASLVKPDGASPAVLIEHARAFGETRLILEQVLVLRAPVLVAADANCGGSEADDKGLRTIAMQRAHWILDITEQRASGALTEDVEDFDEFLVSAHRGIEAVMPERPSGTIALASTLLDRKASQAALELLERWWKTVGQRAPAPLQGRARLATARASNDVGRPSETLTMLAGDARPEAKLLVAKAQRQSQELEGAEALLVDMVEDPSLDPLIVEQARNAYLEVLLDGNKLDQVESLIAKWPTATSVRERDDRAKLEQRLASMRDGTGRTKNAEAAGEGAGPDKRPSR